MSMDRIVVDRAVIDRKLESFTNKINRLRKVLARLDEIISALSKVSWISKGARAFLAKFQLIRRQVEEAIKIVDKYIHDLTTLRNAFFNIENAITERANALKDNVFGI